MRPSFARFVVSLTVVLGALLASPQDTVAQEDSSLERSAREMIRRFEYGEATELLTNALTSNLPPEEELVAWRLLAEVRAKANDERGAINAARELYSRDPGQPLPSPQAMPPRIRTIFVDARDQARARGAADVDVQAVIADGRTVVRGELRGSGLAVRVTLGIDDGSGMVEHSPRIEMRSFEQRWPAVSELSYYVIAEAPSGHVVARAGTEAQPRVLRVEGAEEAAVPALTTNDGDDGPNLLPWLVAGGATVVVAVILGIVLAAEPWVEQPTIGAAVTVP